MAASSNTLERQGMTLNLDPEEKEFLSETRRLSKKAFYSATRLLLNDTRWHLIQAQAERAVPRAIFHDELRSSLVGHQLTMYIPENLLDSTRLPDGAIFYLWTNVFHPITTLSFFWDNKKATRSSRGYFLSDGPEVDCAKKAPIIMAFIAEDRSEVLQAFQVDLRPLSCLSQGTTPELRYVSDVEAARLYVMNALNKPHDGLSPEVWLRDGHITRFTGRLRKASFVLRRMISLKQSPKKQSV